LPQAESSLQLAEQHGAGPSSGCAGRSPQAFPGPAQLPQLRETKDFRAIQGRDDLKRLVAELEAKKM